MNIFSLSVAIIAVKKKRFFCFAFFLFFFAFFILIIIFVYPSWLPPVSRQDGESTQEFANKVQEVKSVAECTDVGLNVEKCLAAMQLTQFSSTSTHTFVVNHDGLARVPLKLQPFLDICLSLVMC